MKFIELVRNRISTRSYLNKPVPREHIELCLEAARLAPSASNSQPWYFIAVEQEKTRQKLIEQAFGIAHSFNRFVRQAPVLIVVLTERSKYITRLGGALRKIRYNLVDIGIACDHLTLQAEELGLGTCWLGWFSEKGVKKALDLPASARIDVMISLGYPDKKEKPPKARKSLEQIRKYI